MGNSGCFLRVKSQLRQSRATQPTLHAGCFSVSIIHRTLTWTAGSLTCVQMFTRAIAHGGVRTHVRESAQNVDSGRKIPGCTRKLNLPQRRGGPTIPTELHPRPIYHCKTQICSRKHTHFAATTLFLQLQTREAISQGEKSTLRWQNCISFF